MGRIFKALIVVAAVFLFGLVSINSKAANIYGYCPDSNQAYLFMNDLIGSNFYYKVAKEAYSNAAGASSKLAGVIVKRSMVLHNDDSINLSLTNARFNPDNVVYYALLVDNVTTDNATTSYQKFAGMVGQVVSSQDYLAAITSSTITSPTQNIAFYVDNQTLTATGTNPYMVLAQVVVDNATKGTYKIKDVGTAINVDPGLNPTCSYYPQILISVTMPNEYKDNDVFAEIVPKCGPYYAGSNLDKLGAELNTDYNFTRFKHGDAVIDALTIQTCNPYTCGGSSSCSACTGNCGMPSSGGAVTSGPCVEYIVGYDDICPTTASVSFTLTSSVAENAVTVSFGNDNSSLVECSTSDHKTWTCSASGLEISGSDISGCLQIKADGTDKMLPTTWTISDMNVTAYKNDEPMDVCTINTFNGVAGSWYGGLEAIIPFLKYGNGYQTYIKLFNRNDKDADVYVVTFGVGTTTNSEPQLVALTKLGTIPAHGSKQFTAEEVGEALGLTADQMTFGFPVKLMIMAPSSQGCMNTIGSYDDISLTYSGTSCYNNSNDPYIEGIVVSVTPQGQRSIPLEFKFFKNGSYTQ